MEPRALQDQLGIENLCYGCGAANPDGLQIKSYSEGEETVCNWTPRAAFAAGPPDVLNGGVIATILDCHGVGTAIANSYRLEGRPMGSEPHIWCVTAAMSIEYLKPTPIAPVLLRGRVTSALRRTTRVACSLWSGDVERVRAEVVAVRVR